ncbi:MAG: cell division protein FtsL [Phascolarctobacterium sp.]|nr:cell division protein FtsL [Phascolarctobacterium sp.]MCD8174898.1 cell division protein FtsL [Phascolarctobacterium sp.]
MLARNYDYVCEEYRYKKDVWLKKERENARCMTEDIHRTLRHRILALIAVIMVGYFFAVVRSESMVRYGHELVSLKQQEEQLINKNSELKIEAEQLKGPERIIGIAEKNLGMSVARSNIYIKAAAARNSTAAYALANK